MPDPHEASDKATSFVRRQLARRREIAEQMKAAKISTPIVPCATCGHQVSERAACCPHCGQPNPSGSRAGKRELELSRVSLDRIIWGTFLGLLGFAILGVVVWIVLVGLFGLIVL